MRKIRLVVLAVFFFGTAMQMHGQARAVRTGGNHVVYGDIKVREDPGKGVKPLSLDVLLYNEFGNLMSRQTVSGNGRYRFNDLTEGRYYVVVEVENSEIARINVDFSSPLKTDVREDIELEWRDVSAATKAAVIAAADRYDRPGKNAQMFRKASEAMENKRYDQAAFLLQQIVDSDPKDFPAWEELGRVNFIQKQFDKAEKAYLEALKAHPDYTLVLLSLGRLRIAQKNFEGAVDVLTKAVKLQPESAHANYFLGEAYLQLKKGSIATGYLYEALRLDPIGMAEAHLRLAALYNAVGYKDKAAREYEDFLKKQPDYPDRKKLEQYIDANKNPAKQP
ncbi:MAG TPA: tetratricopeptide repeat protein [Pyrinomonadaceae bacterium]